MYEQFWSDFLAVRKRRHPEWPGDPTPTRTSWLGFPSGLGGTHLAPSFARRRRIRSEMSIVSSRERNERIYSSLLLRRGEIEELYGRELVYEELPDKRMSRIADYRPDSDIRDIESHGDFTEWFLDAEARFRRALGPVIG